MPAVDINQMTISFVENKLDMQGEDLSIASENKDLKSIAAIHLKLLKVMEQSPANKLLKDI